MIEKEDTDEDDNEDIDMESKLLVEELIGDDEDEPDDQEIDDYLDKLEENDD
jgi:hypothetical protein